MLVPALACSPGDEPAGESLGVAGAHEHGVARLDLALDGTRLTADFHAPGMSIVGFEHAPATPEEHAAVDRAIETLRERFDEMLILDGALGCARTSAHTAIASDHDEAAPAPADDSGAHGHPHETETDQNVANVGAHSEVSSRVVFDCERNPAGSSVELAFGRLFPGLSRIDLQLVTSDRQLGRRVPAVGTRFRF